MFLCVVIDKPVLTEKAKAVVAKRRIEKKQEKESVLEPRINYPCGVGSCRKVCLSVFGLKRHKSAKHPSDYQEEVNLLMEEQSSSDEDMFDEWEDDEQSEEKEQEQEEDMNVAQLFRQIDKEDKVDSIARFVCVSVCVCVCVCLCVYVCTY